MSKTILITGATDGIGRLTAQKLAAQGHHILLHGRSAAKLDAAAKEVGGDVACFRCDLADLNDVKRMVQTLIDRRKPIDVLINNAGVLKTANPLTDAGLDVRFVVNTLAPYLLTQGLLPLLPADGRIVNLSSAAQAPVDVATMSGSTPADALSAYAQSKLAITIWTRELAKDLPQGQVCLAVNPGSLLASKMVKEGFGIAGNDLDIGADILCRTALDPAFANASGQYFDNDSGRFSDPHSAAMDPGHVAMVMQMIDDTLSAHRS